jgi:hypothetical protein
LALGGAGGSWDYEVPACYLATGVMPSRRRGCGTSNCTQRDRHACATLMHLQGVPVAVIAAWIGHKNPSLTMSLYAHSQFAALQDAGASLDRVVTLCDIEVRGHVR